MRIFAAVMRSGIAVASLDAYDFAMRSSRKTEIQRIRRARLVPVLVASVVLGVSVLAPRSTWMSAELHGMWWVAAPGVLVTWLCLIPFTRRILALRKTLRRTRGLACPYCLYDLGHQQGEEGKCPECGEPYSLVEVHRLWRGWYKPRMYRGGE